MVKAGHVLKLGWKLKALTQEGWSGGEEAGAKPPEQGGGWKAASDAAVAPPQVPQSRRPRQRVASGPDGTVGFALKRVSPAQSQ
jgi:hypothetical protein